MADFKPISAIHMSDKQRLYRISFPILFLSILIVISACDSGIVGDITGEVTPNSPPEVEFANVPADQDTFGYAPVIYWKGKDSDGFVEYYEYADIIDSTALDDPIYYRDFIPSSAWIRTESTSDTVYLLTESGKITEHVFYLRCVDDKDVSSEIKYRTFFRSNEPPFAPEIKWFLDSDEDFNNDVVISDTLYVLDDMNETWPGLGFNWKSTDPDDRDLYRIPLEYYYYLEKTPHDTIWQWVSPEWTQDQDLQIFDLETGHYKLTVWARDDGFELSERPASIVFDVYRPSFEKSILLLDCNDVFRLDGFGDVIPPSIVSDEYDRLMEQSAWRFPDWERILCPEELPSLYKSYIGKYKLIILMTDNAKAPDIVDGPSFEDQLVDYMDVGGKVWVMGSFLGSKGIFDGYLESSVDLTDQRFEMASAIPGVNDMPEIGIQTERISSTYELFLDEGDYPFLPGVDIMQTPANAETVFYINSYTDTASGDIFNEYAKVTVSVDTIYFPPTPFNCLIKLQNQRVSEVTRVENVTRGEFGEVVTITNNVGPSRDTVVNISYASGEPWAIEDSVFVDYTYLPFSDFHFKPCAFRFEELSGTDSGFEIRYRLAIFSFPIYLLDDSDGAVSQMFASMLDWFFLPYAH